MPAAPSSKAPRTCSSTASRPRCWGTRPIAAASPSVGRATFSSTVNRRPVPATSPRDVRANSESLARRGIVMRFVSPWRRCRRFLAVSLVTLALVGPADAQQASKELSDLRQTASDLYKSGDFAQSLGFYERATPLVIRDFGAEHEQTAIHYHSLGLVAEAAGNLASAESYYRAAIPIREKVYGPDSAGTAVALDQLAAVYLKMGRPDAADPLVKRAAQIRWVVGALIGPYHAFFGGDHATR